MRSAPKAGDRDQAIRAGTARSQARTINSARPQVAHVAGSMTKGSRGKADGENAEELYRLAGKVVCVEQEVANKVEMCVASRRNAKGREAGDAQGDGVTRAGDAEPPIPSPGGSAPTDVPGSRAETREKVKYLKYYWKEMRTRWRLYVSEGQFASYVIDSYSNRCAVAHSTIVGDGRALTNVHEGRDFGVSDLEGFLGRTYRALDAINMLCKYMGLDDYAGYVRQRRVEGKGGGRAAHVASGSAGKGAPAGQAMGGR